MYDESHASKRKSQEDESLKDNAKQKSNAKVRNQEREARENSDRVTEQRNLRGQAKKGAGRMPWH